MRPAVDALTHSDFLGSRSVTPSQARNTAHFVLTILELWGGLQRYLQNSKKPLADGVPSGPGSETPR